MNVVVEDAGTCRKKIRIEWPAERVQDEYQKLLGQYRKMAKISGFRPGKAPAGLVEKRYGKDILKDVEEMLVPEGYQRAIKEKHLTVVDVKELDEPKMELGQDMVFSVTVEVAPEFALPDYKGIALARQPVVVEDGQVEDAISNILDQFASYEEVEGRPVQLGDLVMVDYDGVCEGQSIEEMGEEVKGLGKRESFWLYLNESAFIPEFADGLAGAQVGETREIVAHFADSFGAQVLAGKEATYTVEVKGIREKILPTMDAAFYERLGVKDENDLRERIRNDMLKGAEQRETSRLRNAVVDHLIKGLDVELPPTAVARETAQILQEIIRDTRSRGAGEDALRDKRDEIVDMANRNAEARVKAHFILDRIGDQEEISVSAGEMERHLDALAHSYQMKPEALREQLKKRDAMDTIKAELRRSKVIDWLMDSAAISEQV
jgi:trigger factor